MASYWIYEPAGAAAGSVEAASRAVIVRDGWSWGALLLGPIWTLWRGLWVMFLVWLALIAAQMLVEQTWPQLAVLAAILMTLFSVWFALEGNALRSAALARKGYRLSAITVARSLSEAEHAYMASLKSAAPTEPAPTVDRIVEPVFEAAPATPPAEVPAPVDAAPIQPTPPPTPEPAPIAAARPGAVHTITPVARTWPLARAREEERSPMPPSPVRGQRATRTAEPPASDPQAPSRTGGLPRATSPFDIPPPRKPDGGSS
ncbi:MAG: DUF2628 domain-containing protein [Labrys sp. (in: a-proteobacteria)]